MKTYTKHQKSLIFTALRPLLAALGPFLGALGPLLGGSRPLLGCSWPLLGRPARACMHARPGTVRNLSSLKTESAG